MNEAAIFGVIGSHDCTERLNLLAIWVMQADVMDRQKTTGIVA